MSSTGKNGSSADGFAGVKVIAALLDLESERRVQQLAAEGVIPKAEHGKYKIAGCVRGYIRYLRKRASKEGILQDERGRLIKAKALREEMRNLKEAGILVEKLKAEKEAFEKARQTRDSVLSVPDRVDAILAAETDQSKCNQLLRKELKQALETVPGVKV